MGGGWHTHTENTRMLTAVSEKEKNKTKNIAKYIQRNKMQKRTKKQNFDKTKYVRNAMKWLQ